MQIKTELVYDDFQQMYQLESTYYDEEFITPVNESYLWYENRPHSIMAVENQSKIIGFMCLFPISKKIALEIKQGQYNDALMTYEDILDTKDLKVSEGVSLFLSCIVVDRAYRNSECLKLLLTTYKSYYESLKAQGVYFTEILSDNVTEEGILFSKRLGLEPYCKTNHDSVIMCGSYEAVIQNIK